MGSESIKSTRELAPSLFGDNHSHAATQASYTAAWADGQIEGEFRDKARVLTKIPRRDACLGGGRALSLLSPWISFVREDSDIIPPVALAVVVRRPLETESVPNHVEDRTEHRISRPLVGENLWQRVGVNAAN